MARIPQDIIDQVLAAHDVVEVVSRSVALTQAGRSFKALCPFHDEKTPSFTVSPDRQTFKCFGCGKGGNVFGFLMEHEGLTFPEAVRSLAKERGIAVPEARERAPGEEGRVEAARAALAFAQKLFVRALASEAGTAARAYLRQRGYDDDAVATFGLGYAPPGWDRLLGAARRKRMPERVLEDAGLVVPGRDGGWYDRFRHRITFPVRDLQGRVVSFGARALSPDDEPKYLNGPETVVFRKASILFALDRARDGIRRRDEALLMEGYTDVLMAHLGGFDHAVAGMGTAFTPQQARLIKRFASRVVLVYDADAAGRQAAERTLDLCLEGDLDVAVALLPEGRDVDEILLEEGPEGFQTVLDAALPFLDFKVKAAGDRHDLDAPRGRARAAEEAIATIVRIPRPVERDQYLRALAESMGDEAMEGALRTEAARVLARRDLRRARRAGATTAERSPASGALPDRVRARTRRLADEALLAGLLFFPDLRGVVLRAVGPEHFPDPVHRRLYNACLALDEAGEGWDLRAVASRLADDAEAQAVLAGLPEDPTLRERVPLQIEHLERRRRKERRTLEILEKLDAAGASSPAGDGPSVASPTGTGPSARDVESPADPASSERAG
jgi:DNA primase